MITKFFVIAALLLSFAGQAVAQECREVPIKKEDIDIGDDPKGYARVALVLQFDPKAYTATGLMYRIILGMDPEKARYDSNQDILQVYKCWGWVEYDISGKRKEYRDDGQAKTLLMSSLLLPDEEIGKVAVQAMVRERPTSQIGRLYKGQWEKWKEHDVLLLTPAEPSPY